MARDDEEAFSQDLAAANLAQAKAEYEAVFGKKPFHSWGEITLRDKIQAANIPPAPPVEGVKVMLLCKSVFLPEDPLDPNWAGSQKTRRYPGETNDRRTKITVHPALAEFLQSRKQAEILD